MSVNVYTEWGALKEIVVGDCVNIDKINVDLSFRLFFHDNIKDVFLKNSIHLKKRLIEQRAEDLDSLSVTLERLGVKVKRPRKLERIKSFETPNFKDYLKPIDNPRDQTLIYGNEIIETPCIWRGRYFENDLMKDIFMEYFSKGSKWTCAPRPEMKDESFDLSYVQRDQDSKVDWSYYDKLKKNYEIMFDGAQCLKFGKDIVMNISNQNHQLGADWLERHLGSKVRIHRVELTDHHIDGMFMPLRPGLLLLNPDSMQKKIEILPRALQKWDHVTVPNYENSQYSEDDVLLASHNIGVNVLPINEQEVIVFGRTIDEAKPLADLLERHGMKSIPVQLRHSRLFGGGVHCVTLDTVREDSLEDYFS